MARLSVVVPFFNVKAYIGEALESIARQTLQDIEVIMVDDGSTDGSALIAKSLTARDPRFRLIEQPNRGLGPARNAGVREASAPYLAFADSDDLVHPHAYELLVSSLECTGSDIACGGVRRFKATGLESSWLHDEAFKETVQRTHVTRRPILLRDRTAKPYAVCGIATDITELKRAEELQARRARQAALRRRSAVAAARLSADRRNER